jgi:putative acetyltransferase
MGLVPPNEAMIIRREIPADREEIRCLLLEAFGRPHESLLVDDLRSAGKVVVSLVALISGSVAGHILFTEVAIAPACPSWKGLGLAPLAVSPPFQGQGVGTELVQSGIEACRREGGTSLFVLGERAYYARFGFVPARSFGLDNIYGADDAFMAMEIIPGALSGKNGTVTYPREFESFS